MHMTKTKQMECPSCKNTNVINLKINIIKPVGCKKYKCNNCFETFIVDPNKKKETSKEICLK
jgi:hypothetical protein